MLRVMLVRFVLYYYIVRSRFKTKCDRFDLASHISLICIDNKSPDSSQERIFYFN